MPNMGSRRDGKPMELKDTIVAKDLPGTLAAAKLSMYPVETSAGRTYTSTQIGVIVPTSLCSSQVSEMLYVPLVTVFLVTLLKPGV